MQVLQKDIHRFMAGFWQIRQNLAIKLNPVLKEKYSISLAEHFLLEHIATSNIKPTELAKTLQIPAHAISKKLESLQSAKLIKRTLDPNDARKRVLTITKKGEKVLEKTTQLIKNEVGDILSRLEADRLEPFLIDLEIIGENK
ncbi:MAG TPA: MarR family transcriptional regulator [Trueperaceae bacterium]|nr:MarR family transcriptional regulator [Trueperaceae bacterium]